MEFRYETESIQTEHQFNVAKLMAIVLAFATILVPVMGILLAVGTCSLFGAATATTLKATVAALIVTLPCAFWLKGIAKTSTAMVYEAHFGEEPAWNR